MTLHAHCDCCPKTAPLAPGDKRPGGWVMWTERTGSEVLSRHRCPECAGAVVTSRARQTVRRGDRVAPGARTEQEGLRW